MTSPFPDRPREVRRDLHGVVVLVDDGDEVARWPLPGRPGLEMVDDLARLQLAARRGGLSVRLRQASPALSELLDLTGLGQVLPAVPLREAEGEAEGGEQAGVEEVVVPDDPVT
jgi:hypothetical protein